MSYDPPPWQWPIGGYYSTCNCACRTCLEGSCCQFHTGMTITTNTSATAILSPCSSGHDFAPFDATTVVCRRCAESRVVK